MCVCICSLASMKDVEQKFFNQPRRNRHTCQYRLLPPSAFLTSKHIVHSLSRRSSRRPLAPPFLAGAVPGAAGGGTLLAGSAACVGEMQPNCEDMTSSGACSAETHKDPGQRQSWTCVGASVVAHRQTQSSEAGLLPSDDTRHFKEVCSQHSASFKCFKMLTHLRMQASTFILADVRACQGSCQPRRDVVRQLDRSSSGSVHGGTDSRLCSDWHDTSGWPRGSSLSHSCLSDQMRWCPKSVGRSNRGTCPRQSQVGGKP